ncbi:unnamed protein product [Dibothriocephalus latus]|uniref:Uncharacterized protein n=1 Tax=Dibothriocephalus latus TaxID=60516 RepID=A0A3P7LLA8_DIBLA|nr:unnamed protein product [Dibothriocephalus latus]
MPQMEEPTEKDDRSPSPPCQEPQTAVSTVSPVTDAEVIKPQSIFGDFQDLDNPSPTKSQGSKSSPQKYPLTTSPNTQSPTISKESPDLEIASPRLTNSDDEDDQPVVNSPTSPALIDCGEKTFNDEEEEMQEDEKYEDNSSDDGADKQSEDEVDDSGEKVGRWTASKGAARKKGSKTKTGTEKGETTKESAKLEIHSETQRLLREHTFVLPQYKPKQYSSFAEFRSHLHSEDSNAPNPPVTPTSPLPASLKPTVPGSNHHDEVEEAPEGANEGVEPSDSGATIAGSTSEPVTSTDATSQEEQKHFKLPENLPPLNLLKANENDIIDLDDETVESTTKEETGLLRLMSRFTQQTRRPEEAPAPIPQKPEEFSIIEKVTDDKTGEAKLVLDTVTYQPSADNAAATTMNRRQWKMHRRKLREIMRSKRLKGYEELAFLITELFVLLLTQDDEWSAGDEDADSSSSDGSDEDTDEEEDDDEAEEEDDSDSVHGASRTKRDHHPLIDDEAEEDGDEDEDGFDADDDSDTETVHSKVDVKTPSKEVSALSYPSLQPEEPDDFTDLPSEAPPVHRMLITFPPFSPLGS